MDFRKLIDAVDSMQKEAKKEPERKVYKTVSDVVADLKNVVFAEPSKSDTKYSSANIQKWTDPRAEAAYKISELSSRIKNNDDLSLFLSNLSGHLHDDNKKVTPPIAKLVKIVLDKHKEMKVEKDPDSEIPYDDGGDNEFEGNAYANAVRKAKMDGKKKGDKIQGPDGEEITLEKEESKEFSDKEIKMAFGVLNDPRYHQGNYSGAVDTIEKIAKGLSKHPSVANALKRANESHDPQSEPTIRQMSDEDLADFLGVDVNEVKRDREAAEEAAEEKNQDYAMDNMESVEENWFNGLTDVTLNGDEFYENFGWIGYDDDSIEEAEYQGRKVKLGKPMRGDVKKFKVYVKNPKGNVVKVNFGDPDMKIKRSNPKRRKSFRARHNCDNPGPRTKARYWSCRKW